MAEYLEKQKQKAILEMAEEENLKQDVVNQVIEECEFNNSRPNYSLIKTAFNKKPSMLGLNRKIENIQGKISNLIERFNFFNLEF